MQELIQMQSCPLGNKDSRPLVGGFSATAYEAMKEFHYSTNLVAMPVKEENSDGGGEEEEKKQAEDVVQVVEQREEQESVQ